MTYWVEHVQFHTRFKGHTFCAYKEARFKYVRLVIKDRIANSTSNGLETPPEWK